MAIFAEAFFKEDKAICERVQKGMRSQLSGGGQLVDMEHVIVGFHQFLATRLFGFPETERCVSTKVALFIQD